jgi:Chromate transport protein ChrA
MLLINIWLQFFLIGLVAFGGGTAMIPVLARVIVEDQGWLSIGQFIDVIGLSQMTPGPIAINAATFIGYQSVILETGELWASLIGATVATLGVLIAPILLMSLVIGFEHKKSVQTWLNRLIYGLKPALVGLIIASALSIGQAIEGSILHFLLLFGLVFALLKTRVHPIIYIVIAGAFGVFVL